MEEITKKKLQAIACKVRMGVIEGTYCAKSGHPGGSLSISDLLTYLYFAKMHIAYVPTGKKDREINDRVLEVEINGNRVVVDNLKKDSETVATVDRKSVV